MTQIANRSFARRTLFLAGGGLALLVLAACSPAGLLNGISRIAGDGGTRVAVRGAPFGPDPRLKLDVYVPANASAGARLPVRLVRHSPTGQVLFERTALHRIAPADWPVAGAGTGNFQRLDAADFGDMQDNPVVQKAQAFDQRAGWRRAHSD